MDLSLTAARDPIPRRAASLARSANVPRDWEQHRLHDSMQERFKFLRAWQKRVFEAGWAGVAWPKEYGGRGASLMEQVIFTQEMAAAGAPPLANVLGLALIGPTIIAFGTEAQKKRYLAEYFERRRNLVPGIFGAERGLRPRRLAHRSASRTAITTSSTARKSGTATAGRPIGARW